MESGIQRPGVKRLMNFMPGIIVVYDICSVALPPRNTEGFATDGDEGYKKKDEPGRIHLEGTLRRVY